MNVITAIQNYIQRMIESVHGMKVLILDHETVILFIIFYNSFSHPSNFLFIY